MTTSTLQGYAALLVHVCHDVGGEMLEGRVRSVLELMRQRGDGHLAKHLPAAVEEAYGEVAGEEEVTITLPKYDDALLSVLAAQLKTRRESIRITEDPTLIGGVRVRRGNRVIDASVAGAVNQLARQLGTSHPRS